MGTALANVAAAAGAEVTLVTTATLPTLPQITVRPVQSATEMHAAVTSVFAACDAVIMAAAVADYHMVSPSAYKLKKTSATSDLTLELAQNPDILATLGATKTHQLVVGFAAETNDLLANAKKKLVKKHADLLVANAVGDGRGFNQATNAVWLLRPSQEPEAVPEASKEAVAAVILKTMQQMMG